MEKVWIFDSNFFVSLLQFTVKLYILMNGRSELIYDNYYYIDKTKYIEKLENFSNKRVMFLRPRKFGKTLFTSVLENYYDILKANKFEKLFKETYIGKNPSKLKNSYHILKFNFSGIDTSTEETTMLRFKEKVENSIESFVKRYQIDFIVNTYQTAEGMLNSLFTAFRLQKQEEKIYVIIDEYDHFANEILTFNKTKFKEMVAFDEKYVKILFYSIAMNLKTIYNVKSEAEVSREYPDLLIVPRDREKTYYSAMIEFKYIKKEDYTEDLLKNKQKEAKEQIQKYAGYEEIRDIKNLKKYTVIAVLDKIYVETL